MSIKFSGVLAAHALPLFEDFSIDYQLLYEDIKYLCETGCVEGIVTTAHACEADLLTFEERAEVIKTVKKATGNNYPVIAGVGSESTAVMIQLAKKARELGADALLVFPPSTWIGGKPQNAPIEYMKALANAVDLPLIPYQYPSWRGKSSYSLDQLRDIVRLPSVIAVKESVWEYCQYEIDCTMLRKDAPNVQILCANDEFLFPSFMFAADATLVSYGALAPYEVSRMLRLTKSENYKEAKEIYDRLIPFTKSIYAADTRSGMRARGKAALVKLGRYKNTVVRPPLLPLTEQEKEEVFAAVEYGKIRVK